MGYIAVAFTSRSSALRFSKDLSAMGIKNIIINTPSSLKRGCGLSVKSQYSAYAAINRLLSRGNYSGFYGVFAIDVDARGQNYRRIF